MILETVMGSDGVTAVKNVNACELMGIGRSLHFF